MAWGELEVVGRVLVEPLAFGDAAAFPGHHEPTFAALSLADAGVQQLMHPHRTLLAVDVEALGLLLHVDSYCVTRQQIRHCFALLRLQVA